MENTQKAVTGLTLEAWAWASITYEGIWSRSALKRAVYLKFVYQVMTRYGFNAVVLPHPSSAAQDRALPGSSAPWSWLLHLGAFASTSQPIFPRFLLFPLIARQLLVGLEDSELSPELLLVLVPSRRFLAPILTLCWVLRPAGSKH